MVEHALEQVAGRREDRPIVEGVAMRLGDGRRAAPQSVRVLLLVQPAPLLLEVRLLALPGAVEAPRPDELDDRLQLAVVEPDAVTLADVHDHARVPGVVATNRFYPLAEMSAETL